MASKEKIFWENNKYWIIPLVIGIVAIVCGIYFGTREGYSHTTKHLSHHAPKHIIGNSKPTLRKGPVSSSGPLVPPSSLNCSTAQKVSVTGNATFISNGTQNGYLWSSANNTLINSGGNSKYGMFMSDKDAASGYTPSATISFGSLPSFMSINVTIVVVGGGQGGYPGMVAPSTATSIPSLAVQPGMGGNGGGFTIFNATLQPNTTLGIGFFGNPDSGLGGKPGNSMSDAAVTVTPPVFGISALLHDITNGSNQILPTNNLVFCTGGAYDGKGVNPSAGGACGTFSQDGKTPVMNTIAATANVTNVVSTIIQNGGVADRTGLGGASYTGSGYDNQSFGMYGIGGAGGNVGQGLIPMPPGNLPNGPVSSSGQAFRRNAQSFKEHFKTNSLLRYGDAQSSQVIADLQAQVSAENDKITSLQAQLATDETTIGTLQSQLANDEAAISKLTDMVNTQNQTIQQLQQQIAAGTVSSSIPSFTTMPPLPTMAPPTAPLPGQDGAPAMVMVMWNLN